MQRMQEVVPEYGSLVASAPRLLRFRQSTGLPKSAQVWEYLLAFDGTNWVALMRGKFTDMGMEPRLEKPGAQRLSRAGVTVLGDENGAVAFLNPTTAIGGTLQAVTRALDRRNENTGIPEPLLKLASDISSENEIWFASTGVAPGFVPAARVTSARGGMDVETRQINLVMEAESEEAARMMAEAVNGQTSGTRVTARGPASPQIMEWVRGSEVTKASVRLPH